jgi:hypothetical protein
VPKLQGQWAFQRLLYVVIHQNAGGNAVATKRFSISNPRERQLAFTALLGRFSWLM